MVTAVLLFLKGLNWSKFLSYWKWLLGVGLLAVAFLSGAYVTQSYYTNRIQSIEVSHAKQLIRFQDKIIEQDSRYAGQASRLNQELSKVKKELSSELGKEAYKCPVPPDGVRMLNNAIQSIQQD